MFFVLLIAVTAQAVPTPNPTNPLALAEQGLSQCWVPDLKRKTCRLIASYRKTGPGTYDNKAIVALSREGSMSLETHTPVIVRGDSVCGKVRTQDVKEGILRRGDQVVSTLEAQQVLDRVAELVTPLDGRESCTRYEASGGDFTAKISIDGKYRPENDTDVKWINPTEGYAVAP